MATNTRNTTTNINPLWNLHAHYTVPECHSHRRPLSIAFPRLRLRGVDDYYYLLLGDKARLSRFIPSHLAG